MNAAMMFRVISLIPDRSARAQSGSAFNAGEPTVCKHPERMALLAKFLHWLGPLDALTKEQQQFLGLRSGGGRSMAEADAGEEVEAAAEMEAGDDLEIGDELEEPDEPQVDEQPVRHPEAGTQIAA